MSSDQTVRTVLHSAYTFVRSVESNKASSALTLDHLIQEQIDAYQQNGQTAILDAAGNNVGNRLSKLDQLDTLKQQLDSVVQSISNAGKDPEKLNELGIFEAGTNTPDGTDDSSGGQQT